MQHHRSMGTIALVALMAAHRLPPKRPAQGRMPPPLDPRTVSDILDRLWEDGTADQRQHEATAALRR